MVTTQIEIQGIVQGVGFRPFIKKLADSRKIKGTVINTSNGVIIKANINQNEVELFIKDIYNKAPSLSHIVDINVHVIPYIEFNEFQIEQSEVTKGITLIPPDMAICSSVQGKC